MPVRIFTYIKNEQLLLEDWLNHHGEIVPWWAIHVVDNNSDDNSLEFVKQNFPQVKLISLDKNYGFAEGYNIGLKHVNEDIICILNNDIDVTDKWLDPIKRKLKDNKNYSDIFKSATKQALEEFKGKKIKIGRARMFEDKTKDLDDPGMFALHRLTNAF